MVLKRYKFTALLVAAIVSITLSGCDSSPVFYSQSIMSQGTNPSLSGHIEGWSNEKIAAQLTFNYNGVYDSAALFLDDTKVSNVREFPFAAEYDITKLSSPAPHVYQGKVWTQDTMLTSRFRFEFIH